ncbi:hypothetical protein BJY04DRAFT_212815 [Aspergillus karnatakaensis]|uniref:uncharacterized protein n=1 Tax=Aspergillus karnatakaensis TaxID=1810916 RepID=UPI003CCCAD49
MSRAAATVLLLCTRLPCRLSSKSSRRTARLISTTPSKPPSSPAATGHNESLFHFTRARFLANESKELAQRHAPFNVAELAKLAVKAAETTSNRRGTCLAVEKLPDGMHNKAVRFTMDNGFQVIGNVPNPNAGLPHYTTASEVATMDFLKHLIPEDENITTSHLWHDDLHIENVFVKPDDPSEIYAFIDWQSTELAPLYDHIIEPYILEYDGPPLNDLLKRPKLADIEALFQDEPAAMAKRKASSLFRKMSLVALYRFLLYKKMPRLFKALEFCQTDCFQLLLLARNLQIDDEATYLSLLAEQQENKWCGVPRISQGMQQAPLYFSTEEIRRIHQDAEAAARSIELMGDLRIMIGSQYFQAQGLVSHGQFRELEQLLPRVKEEFVRMHAGSKEEEVELSRAWPLRSTRLSISMSGSHRERALQVEHKQ